MTLLVVANWQFFDAFVVAAVFVGIWLAVVVRSWHSRHPGTLPDARQASASRVPELNVSAIPVGGDAGGLVFAIGSIAVVVMGVPDLGWYFLGIFLCAWLFAGGLFTWRAAHSWQPQRATSIGRF
jgi:hypothetical protein